jgi:hypothetical protein
MQGVGHDINKVCKMSKARIQGNLMGFASKPKSIFLGMGLQDKEYSILNPKPKPIHFKASLAHSGLGSWG